MLCGNGPVTGITSVVPAAGDSSVTPLQQITVTPNYPATGSTAYAYRPNHLNFTYLATDQPGLTNVYQGQTSTVIIGDSTHAAAGTLHNFSARFIVTNNGDANSEHAAYFGYLRYDGNATPGRAWFTDWNVHGAIATQQSKLDGITMFINNHYNGSPSGSASAAQWLVTQAGTGGGTDSAHLAATTYPVDVGLGIVGKSSSDGIGFTTGIQIGGQGSGWPVSSSRFGTGVLVRDYDVTGLRIKSRYSGSSAPALVVEQGQGAVGVGVNAPSDGVLCVDGTGYLAALAVTNGPLKYLPGVSTASVVTSLVSGETTARYLMGADGHQEWGPGSAGRDITATYRAAGSDVTGNGATLKIVVPQVSIAGAGLHIATPNSVSGDSMWLKLNNDRARFGYNGAAGRVQIDDGSATAAKDFALRTGGADRIVVTSSSGLVSVAAGQLQVSGSGVGFNGVTPSRPTIASGATAADIRTALIAIGLFQ